jgi:hypothetical protein
LKQEQSDSLTLIIQYFGTARIVYEKQWEGAREIRSGHFWYYQGSETRLNSLNEFRGFPFHKPAWMPGPPLSTRARVGSAMLCTRSLYTQECAQQFVRMDNVAATVAAMGINDPTPAIFG